MLGLAGDAADIDITDWVTEGTTPRSKLLRLEFPFPVRIDHGQGDGVVETQIDRLEIRRMKAGELDLLATKAAEKEPLVAMRGLLQRLIIDPDTITHRHLAEEMDAADLLRAAKVIEGFLPMSRQVPAAG